jgi:hypothetical protein
MIMILEKKPVDGVKPKRFAKLRNLFRAETYHPLLARMMPESQFARDIKIQRMERDIPKMAALAAQGDGQKCLDSLSSLLGGALMGLDLDVAIPSLAICLSSPDPKIRDYSHLALLEVSRSGKDIRLAVPALLESIFSHRDNEERDNAFQALMLSLHNFDAELLKLVALKINCMCAGGEFRLEADKNSAWYVGVMQKSAGITSAVERLLREAA